MLPMTMATGSPCLRLPILASVLLPDLVCPLQAVADCVDAEVPESVIRQVGENEYQAKLHELQVKVCASCRTPQAPADVSVLLQCWCCCQRPQSMHQEQDCREAALELLRATCPDPEPMLCQPALKTAEKWGNAVLSYMRSVMLCRRQCLMSSWTSL